MNKHITDITAELLKTQNHRIRTFSTALCNAEQNRMAVTSFNLLFAPFQNSSSDSIEVLPVRDQNDFL